MTVKEISGKWHTVNKAGKVGKRGFRTKENAEAAQARGRARAATSPLQLTSVGSPAPAVITADNPDTAAERKALGIPPKRIPKDPEAF